MLKYSNNVFLKYLVKICKRETVFNTILFKNSLSFCGFFHASDFYCRFKIKHNQNSTLKVELNVLRCVLTKRAGKTEVANQNHSYILISDF